MRCEEVQSVLSAYTDGELAQKQSGRVAEHLVGCEACALEARAVQAIAAVLRALPEEEPPTGLHHSIIAALDATQPSVWQRILAAVLPLQPLPRLAVGTAVLALIAMAVGPTPLHRAAWQGHPVASIPHRTDARPIAAAPLSAPPRAVQVVPVEVPPPTMVAEDSPVAVASPTVTPAAPRPIVKLVQGSQRAVAPVAPPPAPAQAKKSSRGKPGQRGSTPAPLPTFDPLAPVLDMNTSPADPAMANVVMADVPASMQSPDTTMVAAMPSGPDVTEASTSGDDLATLRQRLAQEQLDLPTPQPAGTPPSADKPRPRKTKVIPIIHSEF